MPKQRRVRVRVRRLRAATLLARAYAWSGRPRVEAAVTASVVAISRCSISARPTIGPIALRGGACACGESQVRTAAAAEMCSGRDALLLRSLIGEASGREALAELLLVVSYRKRLVGLQGSVEWPISEPRARDGRRPLPLSTNSHSGAARITGGNRPYLSLMRWIGRPLRSAMVRAPDAVRRLRWVRVRGGGVSGERLCCEIVRGVRQSPNVGHMVVFSGRRTREPAPDMRSRVSRRVGMVSPSWSPFLRRSSSSMDGGGLLIGRERELVEVERMLGSARLVTVTGAGGCGKSRLSLEVAERAVSSALCGPAVVIEVAGAASAEQLVDAVLRAVGARERVGRRPLQVLLEHLAERRLLARVRQLRAFGGGGRACRARAP